MTAKEYRSIARENLTGTWGLAIGVAAVACLLGGIGTQFLPEINRRIDPTSLRSLVELGTASLFSAASLLSLCAFIIGGTLEIGYCQFLLEQHDHKPLAFATLFSRFDRFTTGFCQKFLRGLYVLLWSLLLIVPGVMAAYSYAMTPYILAENPDMGATEAIATSKEMMAGHRWELFCLDFSFIGWSILAALTLNLGNLALNPYKSAARAAFYRRLGENRYL